MSLSSWVTQCNCETVNVTTHMFDREFTICTFTSSRLLHNNRQKSWGRTSVCQTHIINYKGWLVEYRVDVLRGVWNHSLLHSCTVLYIINTQQFALIVSSKFGTSLTGAVSAMALCCIIRFLAKNRVNITFCSIWERYILQVLHFWTLK